MLRRMGGRRIPENRQSYLAPKMLRAIKIDLVIFLSIDDYASSQIEI